MLFDKVSVPRDVNYVVGVAATLLTAPVLVDSGIVKTVRGQVGQDTSFLQDQRPLTGALNLVLTAEVDKWRVKIGDYVARTFATTDVDVATDRITETGHNYLTGDGPYQFTTTTTLPAGIALTTDHWLIVDPLFPDEYQVATTRQNAFDGTQVDITDQGTGTHTITGEVGLVDAPAATTTNGAGGIGLVATESIIIPSVTFVTVKGPQAGSILSFFWSS